MNSSFRFIARPALSLFFAAVLPATPENPVPVLVSTAAAPDSTLRAAARDALTRAGRALHDISTEGGYLWRYSPDLKIRGGEAPATATQIWVQPPGTPSLGRTFLRAYAITRDPFWLEAARDAADSLARGQLESGGWDYVIEFDPAKRLAWRYRLDGDATSPPRSPDSNPATAPAPSANASRPASRKNNSTYDDNNTQSALRFLLAFVDAARSAPDPRDARIQEALDYGLTKLIEAQYPNGAWPQRWDGRAHDPAKFPVKPASIPETYPREQPDGSYYSHYTFNDNTHRDVVLTLLDAWHRTGRDDCLAAARRGADFLILARLPEPQPLWAQQYDANLQPAWARAFEPPSVTTGESAGIIRLLVDMYLEFGDEKYLRPIPPAIDWLRNNQIAPGRWARLYELGTDKPIYGDRDKKIHYTLAEVSEERRRGYGWEGSFGIPEAIRYFESVTAAGRDAWLKKYPTRPYMRTPAAELPSRPPAGATVRAIIDSLSPAGFWITTRPAKLIDPQQTTWIETEIFIRHATALCDYLAASRK